MEKDYLEFFKMQVEHANRVSDSVLALSGLIVAIAFFVVGYQIYINHRAVQKIKNENKALLTETIKPLFITSLREQLKLGGISYKSITSAINYYKSHLQDEEEPTKEIHYYLVMCIVERIRSLDLDYEDSGTNTPEDFRNILKDTYDNWNNLFKTESIITTDHNSYSIKSVIKSKKDAYRTFQEGLDVINDLTKLTNQS